MMRSNAAEEFSPSNTPLNWPRQVSRTQNLPEHMPGSQSGRDGKSSHEMTDDVERYWFVVAVFREPSDLATTLEDLHASQLVDRGLLVLTNDHAADLRKAVRGRNGGATNVFVPGANGEFFSETDAALPRGLSILLHAIEMGAGRARLRADLSGGETPSPVYSQLLKDISDGAIVLIATAAGPEKQLQGARLLLRGNCECVLTHELAESGT